MNSQKYNKGLSRLEIGLIKKVMDWLDEHELPYKKEDIKRITNSKGSTEAFEIILDKDTKAQYYEGTTHAPLFLESEIKIIINIRS